MCVSHTTVAHADGDPSKTIDLALENLDLGDYSAAKSQLDSVLEDASDTADVRLQLVWLMRNGYGVQVYDRKQRFAVVLGVHPMPDGSQEVANVSFSRGLNPRQHPLLSVSVAQ